VTATAGDLEHAFSVSLNRYVVPATATSPSRTAYAADAAPALASTITGDVQAVIGLNDLTVPEPLGIPASAGHHGSPRLWGEEFGPTTPIPGASGQSTGTRRADAAADGALQANTAAANPCAEATSSAGSWGNYTYDQLASAYGLDGLYSAGDFGAGQTIAVFELEPNLSSDISAFQACYGTSATVNYTSVQGGSGSGAGSGEAALDIETALALAPAATIDVYDGPNTGSGSYATWSRIVSDDKAQVVSTSWGKCEAENTNSSEVQSENTLFQEAAVQGQSVFAASGDTGSEECDRADGDAYTLSTLDPASQPYVTGVGGTALYNFDANPADRDEEVWNDTGSSGGGISEYWSMPNYQADAPASLGVVSSVSSGSPCGANTGDCREVPDVSADASPYTGYGIYYDGTGDPTDSAAWSAIGGTSAATPLWAAVTAEMNASSSCNNNAIGFANPALYIAAAGSSYGSDFYDVTAGDNDWTGENGGLYSATTGYDMATGLGAPNTASLAATLCSETVRLTNPGAQTAVYTAPVSLQIAASGGAGQALTYSAAGLPAGLSISSSGLISGTPTATTASPAKVTVTATSSSGLLGGTTFTINVVPTTITIANPGSQTFTNRSPISALTLVSTDTGANRTLVYSQTGLPAGLSMSSSGQITGTPTALGSSAVNVTVKDGTGTIATATFNATVIATTVTLRRPKNQRSHLGQRVALALAGTDSGAGETLSYRAARLPAGLRISAAGMITGTPRKTGRYHTTVTTRDRTGSHAKVRFTWVVNNAAYAQSTVGGIKTGRPKLILSVHAGAGKPIRTLTITLPKSLKLTGTAASLRRHIVVAVSGGRGTHLTLNERRGVITVVVAGGSKVKLTVRPGDLKATRALFKAVKARRHQTLTAKVSFRRTDGKLVRLKARATVG
jgi:kumamolisin